MNEAIFMIYHTKCQYCGNELEGKRRCPLCKAFCCVRCGATKATLVLIHSYGRVCANCIAQHSGDSLTRR